MITISTYDENDKDQLKALVIELHQYVKQFDENMPDASQIIDSYFDYLLVQVTQTEGTIHIAKISNQIIGYCVQFGRVLNDEKDEKAYYYSYISDLYVKEDYRNEAVGKSLLEQAELYAKMINVESVRLNAFFENTQAIRFYNKNGYQSRVISLEKNIK